MFELWQNLGISFSSTMLSESSVLAKGQKMVQCVIDAILPITYSFTNSNPVKLSIPFNYMMPTSH